MGELVTKDVTRVVVVDDHRAFADAISLAIGAEGGLRCVGTFESAERAIDAVRGSCPDVVLLDLKLPGMGGIEAIGELRGTCPEVRVVVLTADTSADSLVAAAQAGADVFLPKEQPFADVLVAIREEDAAPFDRRSAGAVLAAAARAGQPAGDVPDLTEREEEVLHLLAEAQSVKAIAQMLDISVHTCRGHIRSLLRKFGAHSQLEVVVHAARLGLLQNLRGGA